LTILIAWDSYQVLCWKHKITQAYLKVLCLLNLQLPATFGAPLKMFWSTFWISRTAQAATQVFCWSILTTQAYL
jgi:hypothetical protein